MRTTRTALALACALALVFASATPAFAADWKTAPPSAKKLAALRLLSPISALSVGAAALDDDIPGVAKSLPFSLNDTLDPSTDWADVYKVSLAAGQVITLTMSGPSTTDFDLFLFPPGTTSLGDDAVDGSAGDESDESIVYAGEAGDYYVVAYCNEFSAAGTYSLTATVRTLTGDDDITGTAKTLPIVALSDSIDNSEEYADADDVFAVYLTAGQTLDAALTDCPQDGDIALFLWNSAAETVWGGDTGLVYPVVGDPGPTLHYTAPVAGTYYLDVAAYPGFAGTYTLNASATGRQATTVTIRTAATTTYIGKTVPLSGAVTPNAMRGVNMVVYVMKPGKTYWTYSSNRTVYALGGGAAWLYKYYFKKGMAKGTYKFKGVAPAPGFASSAGFLTSTSSTVYIRVR
jgi:hypothetical protein